MPSAGSAQADALFGPDFLAGLEAVALAARRQGASSSSGGRAGRRLGDGLEFADHREYVPGDELRTLDWPAYARLGKLFVRQFHQHDDRVVHVLVDASASMAGAKFDTARRRAAVLAYLALANLDRAVVSEVRDGRVGSAGAPSRRGRDQVFAVMEQLAGMVAGGTCGWVGAVRAYADRVREPGLVVLLGDLWEDADPGPALDALAARGHEFFAVQVVEPAELDPAADPVFRGRMRLTDVESGDDARPVVTASLLEAYREEAAAFMADLQSRFTARRAGLVRTTTATPTLRFVRDLAATGLARE